MRTLAPCLTLLTLLTAAHSIRAHGHEQAAPGPLPYADDPAILKIIQDLPPGAGVSLPPTRSVEGGNKLETGDALPEHGPRLKDFSNKMPYIPSRQTAFHCGGGHAHQRYNDAWEYHLGSNTWVRLLASEGGDQGSIKLGWFVCRKLYQNPSATLNDKEKAAIKRIRAWFKNYAVIKDGHVQTKTTGAGFMTSHTWDGLTYDPLAHKAIHFSGHAKMDDYLCYFVLLGDYTPENFEEKREAFKKTLRLYNSPMWLFDFKNFRWEKHYQEGTNFKINNGAGAFMHYIPDLKKSICYQVHKKPYSMNYFDAVSNTLEEVNPNGGESLSALVQSKISPSRESQVAYSEKHKLLVAVHSTDTWIYD